MVFPDETPPIELGSTVIGQFQFLSPKEVLPQLQVGTTFQLWDGGIFAHGKVTTLL